MSRKVSQKTKKTVAASQEWKCFTVLDETYEVDHIVPLHSNVFQEAIDHCRWKKVLHNEVLTRTEFQEHNLHNFVNKSFYEILLFVHNICDKVYGIGMLTVYDITSAICRYNKINIDKIYVIGNGPKRAIKLLNIKAKTQKIGSITLRYVEIPEVLRAFKERNYEINFNSNNGDVFETYLCNWQKDF